MTPRTSSAASTARRTLAGLGSAVLLAGTVVVSSPGVSSPLVLAAADPATECASAVVSGMTLDQQVGQLFVAGVPATGATADQLAAVTSEHLGGVILTGRSSAGTTATRQVTDALRARSGGAVSDGVGLWVSTDQEGGFVQVLSGPGFSTIPTALVQGGLPTATLRADATAWGQQLRVAGVDLDLAPVLDTVPASLGTGNAPIGFFAREYAHDPAGVSASGTAFLGGLQSAGELATAKHFPGLGRVTGNTDTTAGVTDTVTVRGDAFLQPFADAVRAGIPVVMVSSAIYSRIDPATIATFSPTIVTGMLRGDLGFGGVIMTDSLGAAALSAVPVADRAVRFIAAGGTVALSAEPAIVPAMVAGVLARAQSDSVFRGQVAAAAQTVLRVKFQVGMVTCPDAAGAITERWIQLGGLASFLGAPVGAVVSQPGGAEQSFQHGAISWSPSTGAHAVSGAILGTWSAQGRGPGLGYPVADMFCGLTGGGCAQYFTHGAVYWSPGTGAHSISGAILDTWAAHGYELGLGYPVGDMFCGLTGGGCGQYFARGAVYWSPATGAHTSNGAILDTWVAHGYELGLGYPVTDLFCGLRGGGCAQYFTSGAIYWSPATSAHTMTGAILDAWAAQGYEVGALGYPIAERVAVPVGWQQQFQGGALVWNTSTGVVSRG